MSTFPGTSTAQAVAADDWVENQQSAILQSFCLPDQRTFQQHMEEGAITSGSQNAKKLGKRKISESNAEDGTCTVPFKSKLTLDSRSSHESRIESPFSMGASRFSMFASQFSYSIPARLAKPERLLFEFRVINSRL